MFSFIKKPLSLLTTLLIQISITTIAMEQELQLQPAKKKLIKHVNCSIMIPYGTTQSVAYAIKTVHAAIFEHSNLQSTMKDPIVLMNVQNNSSSNSFYLPLPAKLFINCTDGSLLQLHEADGSKLFKSHPVFKKIPLHITAICTKNPNLKGDNFAEQFNNAMNQFYNNPGKSWKDEKYKDELEMAGIMTESIPKPCIMLGPYGPFVVYASISQHGPNGCPNKETFIESYLKDIIQPQAILIYWLLKQYKWDQQNNLLTEIIQSIITKLYLSHYPVLYFK